MHTTWANDPVNSPNHYTRSHPGMECIELTADTSFCLGNAIKYLWRYHSKGRPVEDLEKARLGRQAVRPDEPAEKGTRMNDIDIDVNVTAWKIGLVIIMRGTATPTARVSHPECFGRFTALALSCDGAIRKCMRRVAMMCARHSACERLDRQEARG